FLAIGELAGQGAAVERAFAADQIARLPRRFTRARRIDRLADDPPGDGRILFEIRTELVVEDRLDDPFDFGVSKLRLGLAFELRVRDLHADHRRQAFADVLAGDALLQVFREIVLRRVRVDRAGQRRLEAGEVRAALVRVDVVGEG